MNSAYVANKMFTKATGQTVKYVFIAGVYMGAHLNISSVWSSAFRVTIQMRLVIQANDDLLNSKVHGIWIVL